MPVYKMLFRVLLSSPSDLPTERTIVSRIIQEVNDYHKSSPFGLQLFSWENDVDPALTMHEPQLDIDKVFSYDTSDLIIGLFHKKVGTPVLGSASGTLHEIEEAVNSYNTKGNPEIKLYFKRIRNRYSETTEKERQNFEQVEAVKAKYQRFGIVQSFTSPSEFESLCRKHIMHFFQEQCAKYQRRADSLDSMVSIKSRRSFERMESIIDNAKTDIFILGINLEGALNLRDQLLRKSEQGIHIRLLALDPDGESLEYFRINEVTSNVKRQKIINNLHLLYQYAQNPNIELRIIDNIFTSGCTGIDIDSSNHGRIVAQQYLYRVGTSDAPILDIYEDETSHCYKKYCEYLENLWAAAKPFQM